MKLSAQQRLLKIVEIMSEHGYVGVKNVDLMAATNVSAAVISRDLVTLRDQGWAERKPDGRMRLTPTFAAFSARIAQSLRDARLEIQREESIYTTAMTGGTHE